MTSPLRKLATCLLLWSLVVGCQEQPAASGSGAVVLPTPLVEGVTTARRGGAATANPRRVEFDPADDRRLLVMEANGDLQLWVLPAAMTRRASAVAPAGSKGAELAVTIPAEAIDARFIARGRAILVGDANGSVSLWRPDGQRLWSRQTDGSSVRAVATHGDLLAAGSDSGDLLVWRLDGSMAYRRPLAHDGAIISLAFSAAGDVLVSEGTDTVVRGWRVLPDQALLAEIATYREANERFRGMLPSLIRLDVQWGWDRSLAFLSDRDALAAVGFSGELELFDTGGQAIAQRPDAHDGYQLRTVAVSADGAMIATGGLNMEARIWRAATLRDPIVLKGHGRAVSGVAFDRAGRLASASLDGTVRLWGSDGAHIATLPHKIPPGRRHGAGERRRRVPPNTPIR